MLATLADEFRERTRHLSVSAVVRFCIVFGLPLALAYAAYDGIGLRPVLMLGTAALAVILLKFPRLGVPALILAALVVPVGFGTGTEVSLNVATLLVPILALFWLVRGMLSRRLVWTGSPADRVWIFLLAAGLLSLAIGRATWDPGVPVKGSFILVQMAQWAIFAFAAIAYWLPGMIARPEDVERFTWLLLWVGGTLAVLRVFPVVGDLVESITTAVYARAPFLVLLAGLSCGQLLFNPHISSFRRCFLWLVLATLVYQCTFHGRLSVSEWVGVWSVLALLVWFRFRRLRWVAATVIAVLIVAGILFPSLYEFAGGQLRWEESGASRLLLAGRVLDAAARNPITGLGPAAYRPYTMLQPLRYGDALWFHPQVNSHNNYVDIYAHFGVLGLGLFFWLGLTIWGQLRASVKDRPQGFELGYAQAMSATWVSCLLIMILADWMYPFVYNIGFVGFQASLLVWLFLGGVNVLPRTLRSTAE